MSRKESRECECSVVAGERDVLVLRDEHDGNAGHEAQTSLESLVAGGDEETAVLLNAAEQTGVRVDASVLTDQAVHARVARDPQQHTTHTLTVHLHWIRLRAPHLPSKCSRKNETSYLRATEEVTKTFLLSYFASTAAG